MGEMMRPARSRRGTVAVAAVMLVALTGCGALQPTPARFRPPLPDPQPMPEVRAEEVTERLERLGFRCGFDQGGDVPANWACRTGDQAAMDYMDVSFQSDDTGPILRVFAYRVVQGEPDVLDRDAAARFHASVIEVIVPEEHRPAEAELLEGVQRNYPVELGGGWFLGFDRNSISRSLHVVYFAEN